MSAHPPEAPGEGMERRERRAGRIIAVIGYILIIASAVYGMGPLTSPGTAWMVVVWLVGLLTAEFICGALFGLTAPEPPSKH